MTADDIPKDAPLLRCWLKKSWSTSKKVALWLGGIAVVLIAAYVAWLGLTSQISAKIWAASTGWCGSIISGILNYIATIPPLVFWGSVIVGVIAVGVLGYSLVWCMARNLQDSDWGSDTATAITSAALIALALATSADNPASSWYYVFRFGGAYLNYRKRTKATPTTVGVERID